MYLEQRCLGTWVVGTLQHENCEASEVSYCLFVCLFFICLFVCLFTSIVCLVAVIVFLFVCCNCSFVLLLQC